MAPGLVNRHGSRRDQESALGIGAGRPGAAGTTGTAGATGTGATTPELLFTALAVFVTVTLTSGSGAGVAGGAEGVK